MSCPILEKDNWKFVYSIVLFLKKNLVLYLCVFCDKFIIMPVCYDLQEWNVWLPVLPSDWCLPLRRVDRPPPPDCWSGRWQVRPAWWPCSRPCSACSDRRSLCPATGPQPQSCSSKLNNAAQCYPNNQDNKNNQAYGLGTMKTFEKKKKKYIYSLGGLSNLHIKYPLLLIGKSNPWSDSSGFPPLLCKRPFTIIKSNAIKP